ncbi:PARG [Hemileuca sp. nucleopolyhedrovirus]|uniref:PARG n=1 Tax=Hemileuca sp. nucleopolyhedrovirus TaxID=1367203 RepID=S5MK63_9ABAC|nr:PARG [Hemileuca sp. nucleopolyhedrovirus]AGR56851.1 PARG [Hemileuca sp. nucleopolyhedrovirus]
MNIDIALVKEFAVIQQDFLTVQKDIIQLPRRRSDDNDNNRIVNTLNEIDQRYINFLMRLKSVYSQSESAVVAMQTLYDSDRTILINTRKLVDRHYSRLLELLPSSPTIPLVGDVNEITTMSTTTTTTSPFLIKEEIIDTPLSRGQVTTTMTSLTTLEPTHALISTSALSTTSTLPSPQSMKMKIDYLGIYDELVKHGNTFKLSYLRDFKYQVELNVLLDWSVPDVSDSHHFKLSRIDCAAIVTKALFLDNMSNINFSTIKIASLLNSTLKVKLLCILEYINSMCGLMRDNYINYGDYNFDINHYVKNDIFVNRYSAESQYESVKNSESHIVYDRISVSRGTADPARFEELDLPSQFDLIMLYTNELIGSDATDIGVSKGSLKFLEYPELYAVSHYVDDDTLRLNESVVITNLIKINSIRYKSSDIEYGENIFNSYGTALNNFMAIRSNDVRYDRNARKYDKTVFFNEIDRISSGFSNYTANYESMKDYSIAVHTGPYGMKRNRTFQFLVECLMAMHYKLSINYRALNEEQYNEIVNTLESMRNANIDTVSKLYERLRVYRFAVVGPLNFQSVG